MNRIHPRGARAWCLWLPILACLGGAGCDRSTNPPPQSPLSGSFASAGPDTSYWLTQTFVRDSAFLYSYRRGSPCFSWETRGRFSHNDDSMCISDASVRAPADCASPDSGWERAPDRCYAIRNVASGGYEVLQPIGDPSGPPVWIRFIRLIPD
jgi:hypothetical protein